MTEFLTHYLAPDMDVNCLDDMDVQAPRCQKKRQSPFIEDLNFE